MQWKKTSCALCSNQCGLEVQVENNRIVKVRGDKDNPISEGYVCRKGTSLAYHLHHADRVLYPLKRVGDNFERISWAQAIDEISEKLKAILEEHGPRSVASLFGGGEFGLNGTAHLIRLTRRLGSRYAYSSGNQEFAGRYWAHGLTLGSQGMVFTADHDNSDMMLLIGKNPLQSHHMQQARKKLLKLSKDPDKLLVVVDPRLSETAKIADIHLAIRPGTDALLIKSMIALIIREGWHDEAYISSHVDGFTEILPWFTGFDVKAALAVCELDYDQVFRVCREYATRRSCLHDDLGVLMGRHSALVSYLLVVLMAVCGRIGVTGGNYLAGGGRRANANAPEPWRTQVTDIPALNGMFPPNVLPEEIMSDHPQRIRAVLNHAANPLRSYADTTAYEQAFGKLDLLVTTEIAMSETAALAHYILPSKSIHEAWNGTIGGDVSKSYAGARGPVVEPEGEQKEAAEIFTLLADAMDLIPEIPESLHEAAASGDTGKYRAALADFLAENPKNYGVIEFVVTRTLGQALGSAHLASHFASLMNWGEAPEMAKSAARAGFTIGPNLGLDVYQASLLHPEGVLVAINDTEQNMAQLATENGRFHLYSPEVDDWIKEIDPAEEAERLMPGTEFPLILMAGRHTDMNSNSSMRDPAWNEGRRPCTLAMNPADAEEMGFTDRQMVKITTEAGEELIEIEVSADARKGQVIIPHGFGLIYKGVKYGANVNRLTKNTHRDKFGTPIHRYVPCRVETLPSG